VCQVFCCGDFLFDFIPGALAAIAHVDAIKEQGEGGGAEAEFSLVDIGGFGPGEGAAFEAFGEHPDAAAVPVEDFEQGAAFVCKGEEGSAFGVFAEEGADGVVEAIKAAAHVAGLDGNIDFECAGEV
jgi:hypothetical protein